jgi:hypothetical protein
MQTFLPYPEFGRCAEVLDYRRLGKQRVEAMQILNCLRAVGHARFNGWRWHPAVLMWRGYDEALENYAYEMTSEWAGAGYVNNLKFRRHEKARMPPCLGDERLHKSHQGNLLRKDPKHYGQYFPGADPTLPYFWPVRRSTSMKPASLITHGPHAGYVTRRTRFLVEPPYGFEIESEDHVVLVAGEEEMGFVRRPLGDGAMRIEESP